jgi:3-methyladenine DNA glycosylase AlkD
MSSSLYYRFYRFPTASILDESPDDHLSSPVLLHVGGYANTAHDTAQHTAHESTHDIAPEETIPLPLHSFTDDLAVRLTITPDNPMITTMYTSQEQRILSASDYAKVIQQALEPLADPANAEPMRSYMRNKVEFLGIKSPERRIVLADIIHRYHLPLQHDLPFVVRILWALPYREYQYTAIDILEKCLRSKSYAFDDRVEQIISDILTECITTKSWWDSVDGLADCAGAYFQRYPLRTAATTEQWMQSGNVWLQRVAIIFQLKYKTATDESLLYSYIQRVAHSQEFFLQKAIGWALRQYARTNPDSVRSFVQRQSLSPLSVREAMKHLGG